MTMADKTRGADRKPARKMGTDEALIALFIGAMNANDHVAREELARAHHLIWSTRRFRRKSGETVGRLIDRMKQLLEEEDAAAVAERAARAVPASLRPGHLPWLPICCSPMGRLTLANGGFCGNWPSTSACRSGWRPT